MRHNSLLKSLLLAFAVVAGPVWSAGPETQCADFLLSEFTQAPNDQRQGLVTEKVAIEVEALKAGYRCGLFPWSITPEGFGRWHCPPQRGILKFSDLRIGNSDMRFIRKALASGDYQVTYDKAFRQVIEECRKMERWKIDPKTGDKVRDGEWISDTFIEQYSRLYAAGYAHSTEVWYKGELVAGMYGVYVDGVYAGESMFHKKNDAAKLALYSLVERMSANGHTFVDTQMALGLALKWGAKYVPREEFLQLLESAHKANRPF